MLGNPGHFYPSPYGSAPIPPFFSTSYLQPLSQTQHVTTNLHGHPNPPKAPTYKLYDLEHHEHGEIVRLMFAFAGVPFKDKRLKPEEWAKLKEQQSIETLPVLRINSQLRIFHLDAIIRYLAREFHLYGTGKHDQAIVDMALATHQQLQAKLASPANDDPKGQEATATHPASVHLNQLEKLYDLFHRHGPFFLGSHVSVADLMVYETVSSLLKVDKRLLDNYRRLKDARRRLERHPQLSHYLKGKSPSEQGHTATIAKHAHRHRSHEERRSSRHRHHRHYSKEPTPGSQKKRPSIPPSQSPSLSRKEKERTPISLLADPKTDDTAHS